MRLLAVFVLCWPWPAGAASSITKVDPPSWWASHTINPVRLLITGADLRPGRLTTDSPALRPGPMTVSPDGKYGFVDLTIAAGAKAGLFTLRTGDASARFEILEGLPAHGRFQGLSPDDVIYLIMPDRFANGDPSNDGPGVDRKNPRVYHGGDFRGIVNRLPYLKSLGVTAIWLTPVYDNPSATQPSKYGGYTSYHGYSIVDHYAMEERFGTFAEYRAMVDAAHAHGIKVIQDQVANHTGAEHAWADAPPRASWLHGTPNSHSRSSHELWSLLDPYAAPALRRAVLDGWFVDRLPDLNQDDPEVSRYLIQNALWWVGISGVDAIRQDTVPYVPKDFWRKWNAAIARQYPRLTRIGEVFSSDPAVVSHYEDAGFALFDFPLQDAIRKVFIDGERLRRLPATLIHDRLFTNPLSLVTFFGLHDIPRFSGKGTVESLRQAFTFLLTTRGTPLIYYGDEIGMKGGGDPDNRRDFPGGWPGESDALDTEQESTFRHVQKLLRIRSEQPSLRRGVLLNLLVNDDTYVYARRLKGHPTVVVVMGKAAGARFGLPGMRTESEVTDVLGSGHELKGIGGEFTASGAGVYIF